MKYEWLNTMFEMVSGKVASGLAKAIVNIVVCLILMALSFLAGAWIF